VRNAFLTRCVTAGQYASPLTTLLDFEQNTDGNALPNIKKRKSCRFCLNRRRRDAAGVQSPRSILPPRHRGEGWGKTDGGTERLHFDGLKTFQVFETWKVSTAAIPQNKVVGVLNDAARLSQRMGRKYRIRSVSSPINEEEGAEWIRNITLLWLIETKDS
jgi:hypothetical protein